MMDQIEAMVRHVPDLLQARWYAHQWMQMMIGGIAVLYSFISIFIGHIWSGGAVTLDERPGTFWGSVFAYAVLGSWLLLFV